MITELKWGREETRVEIPDPNVLGVLSPSASLPPVENLAEAVAEILEKPTAGQSLREWMEKVSPKQVVVIVNDMTRSTPSGEMLPPILRLLEGSGVVPEKIRIVIATGTHRAMTEKEVLELLGSDIVGRYRVENHLCDAPDLVDMGVLSTGNRLLLNRTVVESDLRIAVGEVLLHYYAGFAGGRKSILPGVAGRATVMRNHKMMTEPGVGIGILEGNRLYEETDEAVEKFCPLHFIVNIVSDSSKNIVRVVGGHYRDAWMKGVETFRRMNFVEIDRPADAVFVSAGGYPKDINMYQAHKAIYMASRAVRKGGTMIFLAELEEGYGHKVFAEWAERDRTPAEVTRDFEAEFRFGAHKLYYLAQHAMNFEMLLYSRMSALESRRMFCRKIEDLQGAITYLRQKHGNGFSAWVLPQGGIVLPTLREAGR